MADDRESPEPVYDFASPPKYMNGKVAVNASGYSEVRRGPPTKAPSAPLVVRTVSEEVYEYNHLGGFNDDSGGPPIPPKLKQGAKKSGACAIPKQQTQAPKPMAGYTPLATPTAIPVAGYTSLLPRDDGALLNTADPELKRQLDAQAALIAQLQKEKDELAAKEQVQARERDAIAKQLELERLRLQEKEQANAREREWREEKERLLAQQAAMLAQQAALTEQMEKLASSVKDQRAQDKISLLQQQLDDLRRLQEQGDSDDGQAAPPPMPPRPPKTNSASSQDVAPLPTPSRPPKTNSAPSQDAAPLPTPPHPPRAAPSVPTDAPNATDDAGDGGYLYLEDQDGGYLTTAEVEPQAHPAREATTPAQSRTRPQAASSSATSSAASSSRTAVPAQSSPVTRDQGLRAAPGPVPVSASAHASSPPSANRQSRPVSSGAGGLRAAFPADEGALLASPTPTRHKAHAPQQQLHMATGGESSSDFPLVHALPSPAPVLIARPIDAPAFLRAAPDAPVALPQGPLHRAVAAVPVARPPPVASPAPATAEPPSLSTLAHAGVSPAPPAAAAAATPSTQDSHPEQLLCEGYLDKNRGIAQTRNRFFRFTTESFTYYTEEAGEVIASMPACNMEYMSDAGKTKIRLTTKKPLGGADSLETILITSSEAIKNRWLQAFKTFEMSQRAPLAPPREGRLVAEGYLVKVKSMGGSTDRWFVLTTKRLAYFREEAGELMAVVTLDDIANITWRGDTKEFTIRSHVPFTVNGRSEITCAADSVAARNRWLAALRTVVGPAVMQQHY